MYSIVVLYNDLFGRSQFARTARPSPPPLLREAHSFAGGTFGSTTLQPLMSPLTCAPLPISPPRLFPMVAPAAPPVAFADVASVPPPPASSSLMFPTARSSFTLAHQHQHRQHQHQQRASFAPPPTMSQTLSRSLYASTSATHPLGASAVGPYAVYGYQPNAPNGPPTAAAATAKYSCCDSAFGSGAGVLLSAACGGGDGQLSRNCAAVGISPPQSSAFTHSTWGYANGAHSAASAPPSCLQVRRPPQPQVEPHLFRPPLPAHNSPSSSRVCVCVCVCLSPSSRCSSLTSSVSRLAFYSTLL